MSIELIKPNHFSSNPPVDLPSMQNTKFSLILPAYNEYKRADVFKTAIDNYQTQLSDEVDGFELFVFSDGCEKSAEIANVMGATVLKHTDLQNHGRGASIREALTRKDAGRPTITSGIVAYTDADGSYAPTDIFELYSLVASGSDVAVAHRASNQGSSIMRKIAHPVMHGLCERIAPTGVRDPQAGAKAFSRNTIDSIVPQTIIDGWAWDRELLAIAQREGIKVADLGVEITPHDMSTVNAVKDAFNMVYDSYRIRKTHL